MKILRFLFYIGIAVLLLAAGAGFFFYQRPVSFFEDSMYIRETLGGVESRSILVSGHRVHYLAEGPAAGPAVVLVHGLGGHAEDWRNLAPSLAQAGFRVYMPDLLGFGRSEKPRDFSYSVHDEAELVAGFMDTLGIRQADVGGWSMGGGIAQHLAFRHPQRVRRLILFDSVGIQEKPQWNVSLFAPTSAAELNQLDALLMPHPPVVPDFVVRDVLRVSRQRAWVIHRALDTMLTGQDATDWILPQLKMPVLLVWGSEDRIMPLSQGETMHRLLPESQLDVLPGCGHLAPVDCASLITPPMLAFLQQP
jgi:pimeloyl-ACP methyl ester carboxylesterase